MRRCQRFHARGNVLLRKFHIVACTWCTEVVMSQNVRRHQHRSKHGSRETIGPTSKFPIAARMIKISCDNANNCTLEVMSCDSPVLLRKFRMCSMSVKIQLFNTYCSPMYTAQLWWNHTAASFHRLNVA